jgi:hypothetical protein
VIPDQSFIDICRSGSEITKPHPPNFLPAGPVLQRG